MRSVEPQVPVRPIEVPWRRLDTRVLVVVPAQQLGTLVPVVAVLLVSGRGNGTIWQLLSALGPIILVFVAGAVRWATTRYRIGAERVELRAGLIRRSHRSVARDRVRTVDLQASLAHRWFGLTALEVGTGTGTDTGKTGRLRLDGVAVPEAQRMRRELLDPSRIDGHVTASVRPASRPGSDDHQVAELHLSWLRYAPLSGAGLAAVGAVIGFVFKISNDAGVNLTDSDVVHSAGDRLSTAPPLVAVVAVIAVVLLVAGVGSLVVYVEGWWHYRLSRTADGTLRLHRGLLTTRSLSIEQRRIRGAMVIEPLLLRLAGGGRVAAVTTGLDAKTSGKGALLPPAPLEQAHRVASAALGLTDTGLATSAILVRHPMAALRRRMTRAVVPAVVMAALSWLCSDAIDWLAPIWPSALLLVPLAAILAADRYRNLGHALRPEYLVISNGSLVRRRVAVQRSGIIGWRLHQSPLQRWSGVLTLDAITAAGAGRYSVVDITPARALELVARVNPGLLPIRPAPVS